MSFAQYSASQGTSQQNSTMDKESGKAVTLSGKVGDDGKSFTSDKDGKNWTISNPDAVKGHEGHEVKIKAHENAASNELHVTSVNEEREERNYAGGPDAALMRVDIPPCYGPASVVGPFSLPFSSTLFSLQVQSFNSQSPADGTLL